MRPGSGFRRRRDAAAASASCDASVASFALINGRSTIKEMPTPKTARQTKAKRSPKGEPLDDDTPTKRVSLADDVEPAVRDDGELIPGLRPALIANPGPHPSRETGRRRRSGPAVPSLMEPVDQPDDTSGRVTFLFGEALIGSDPEPPAHSEAPPAENVVSEPVGWVTVAVVAALLVIVFVVGIELLK